MAISSGDEDAVPPGPCATTELPAPVVPFAAKAEDLESLRDAVVDAAGIGGGLWFSYLFVLFYLAIAVGGVKHLDLLFENPVKLPFLNVDLPLIGFFVLGPLLILIVHTYVLLHFVLLAGKIRAFHIEQVSLVIGPLALLILFQLQFLPYHHEPITWWQRIAVVADVAILLMLWPSVARGETA